MDNKEKGTTSATARYSESGEISRDDERDQNKSADDWNAEENRTGRNK